MITYFELIKKCLTELNYQKVYNFSELTKNDHDKIKNILNIINAEVLSSDNWNFLLRKSEFTLPANTGELTNSINGKINTLLIDNQKYDYTADFEEFLLGNASSNTYTIFNDKILLPKFPENKTVEIVYYTNNFAQNVSEADISQMQTEDDITQIPMPFAEPILVYGTCMKIKANPEHEKFNYWFSMYKQALANMRSKLISTTVQIPKITISRQ